MLYLCGSLPWPLWRHLVGLALIDLSALSQQELVRATSHTWGPTLCVGSAGFSHSALSLSGWHSWRLLLSASCLPSLLFGFIWAIDLPFSHPTTCTYTVLLLILISHHALYRFTHFTPLFLRLLPLDPVNKFCFFAVVVDADDLSRRWYMIKLDLHINYCCFSQFHSFSCPNTQKHCFSTLESWPTWSPGNQTGSL